MLIIGLDPGLRTTGWGVIAVVGNHLRHVANGAVKTSPAAALAERLRELHDGLRAVCAEHALAEAAVEETFVNRNPASALKLGQARGVVLLVPALAGIAVHEYAANLIKKTVVGAGHAEKAQIHAMVRVLLAGCAITGADAADALAVAICHAHHRPARALAGAYRQAGAAA